MDPFALEFFAIVAATGVTATVFEHARKFSENPEACRLRGWFFVAGGVFGSLILPAMLIDQGSQNPINGFVIGSFFPFLAGAVFIWRSSRAKSGDKSLLQAHRDLKENASGTFSQDELDFIKVANREKAAKEAAEEKGYTDNARQTWPS